MDGVSVVGEIVEFYAPVFKGYPCPKYVHPTCSVISQPLVPLAGAEIRRAGEKAGTAGLGLGPRHGAGARRGIGHGLSQRGFSVTGHVVGGRGGGRGCGCADSAAYACFPCMECVYDSRQKACVSMDACLVIKHAYNPDTVTVCSG